MKSTMSKLMLCALLTIVAAVGSVGAATAATPVSVSYSWAMATLRADGSALPASELAGYEISYTVDGSAPTLISVKPGTTVTSSFTMNLAPRAAPYVLVSSIVAVDTAGRKGAPNTITTNISIAQTAPGALTAFKVLVTCASGTCTAVLQ